MSFVGPVTRVGDRLVRPHDVQVLEHPGEGTQPAEVIRLVRLGFEVRVELQPGRGRAARRASSPAPRRRMLELAEGQIVHVRVEPRRRARRIGSRRDARLGQDGLRPAGGGGARRRRGDGAPVKGERLATSQSIPLRFLENILLQLRHAGLVESRRGAEGGYWLARPAEEITLADVIRAIDGPLAGVSGARPETLDFRGRSEPLREVWIAVRAALREVLEDVTLADVVAGELPDERARARRRAATPGSPTSRELAAQASSSSTAARAAVVGRRPARDRARPRAHRRSRSARADRRPHAARRSPKRRGSRTPRPAQSTRAAFSAMSPAAGQTTTGQPLASARTSVPWPPWQTTTSHAGIVCEYDSHGTSTALAGTSIGGSGSRPF